MLAFLIGVRHRCSSSPSSAHCSLSFLPAAKSALPPDFEETTWNKLKEAITAIQEMRAGTHSKEELYKVCFIDVSGG